MKPNFIILGIVLCVLSSAPLKANPDVLDAAAISGTTPKSAGAFILSTLVVLLTLIAWEKMKFDREHKDNQNTRREAYWLGLKEEKMAYRPTVEEEAALLLPLASHLKVHPPTPAKGDYADYTG